MKKSRSQKVRHKQVCIHCGRERTERVEAFLCGRSMTSKHVWRNEIVQEVET